MYFFYSRISTVGQNAQRQTETFKKLDYFNPSNLYLDKIQGNVTFIERENAFKMFTAASEVKGSVIVVDSIDRLGRNLLDILNTIELFTRNGINLRSLKEGFDTLLPNGKENPTAKIIISVMGTISEMERAKIKERQAEGIAIAKARGGFKGRKVGSIQQNERLLARHPVIVQKLKKKLTVKEIASITGKSTATVMKVKKVLEA